MKKKVENENFVRKRKIQREKKWEKRRKKKVEINKQVKSDK